MVFDKVEEGALCLLEVFNKTNSGCLVGKLRLYEPSTSFGSGQVPACLHQILGAASCTLSGMF